MTDVTMLQQRLLDDLVNGGKPAPPWLEAFTAIPRYQFIPDTIWDDSGGELVPLRRDDDPDRWWQAAYALAAVARCALTTTGYPVTVVTGDGAQGYPPHAPYDRIIATAAVQRVPYRFPR